MADVAATLEGWSSTTDSNAPSGATNIGTSLDNNLREIQGVVVRGLSHKGADIASSTTPALGATEGLLHDITGTATISGWDTVRAGILKVTKFEGAGTLTHNATSFILPSGANITRADGDVAIWISEGSGNWRCIAYQRASGQQVKGVAPTRQVLTSGTSATYTRPAGCTRIFVRMVGGGGGGASGVNGGGSGTAGGNTVFNTATANGGAGGSTTAPTAGGSGGATTGFSNALSIGGTDGTVGSNGISTTGGRGADGSASPFGGAGAGHVAESNGTAAEANSGSGGGGGGGDTDGGGGTAGGGGGAAGQYIEGQISSPSATYTYTIGAGGTGGTAGTAGAGGDGGSGVIIVDEFYD